MTTDFCHSQQHWFTKALKEIDECTLKDSFNYLIPNFYLILHFHLKFWIVQAQRREIKIDISAFHLFVGGIYCLIKIRPETLVDF